MKINKTDEGYFIRYYTENGEYTLITAKTLTDKLLKKLKISKDEYRRILSQ